jgi:hypothetical protein
LEVLGAAKITSVSSATPYSLTVTGGITSTIVNSTQVLAGTVSVSNTGTPGTSNYVYQIVGVSSTGALLPGPYPAGYTNTGNPFLSGANYNTVTWAAMSGTATYNVYRGNFLNPALIGNTASLTFNDTGTAATTSAPTSTVNEVSYSASSTPNYAISGNYMYVNGSTTNALNIFNIGTNPKLPSLVGTIAGNASTDIAISGSYAYVISHASDTLQIFNVSNPASPSLVSTTTIANGLPTSIAVSGNYAYIATDGPEYLDVYNVSVPATPSLSGQVVINNWMGIVSYAKNVVYVSTANNPFTVQAVSVANPASPTILSTLGFAFNGIPNKTTQVISGKYLMNEVSGHFIKVDISNPYNMQIVSDINMGDGGPTLSSGRYLYTVAINGNPGGIDAFRIFDASSGSASLLSSTLTRHSDTALYLNGRYAYVIGGYVQVYDIGGSSAQNAQIDSASITDINVTNSGSFNGDVGIQGGLTLNGQLTATGTALFQNSINSTTAFQIQNSAQTNLLSADTTNMRVIIGSGATGNATGYLLVLDNKTGSATDPTGVTGGMYYNVTLGKFRCYEGGAWRSCIGGAPVNLSTATQSPSAGTDTYLTGSMIPLPTGGMQGPTGSAQNGTLITWRVWMSKTAAGTAASTFTIRFGTNGTTADTARCTAFNTGTATAAADQAVVTITAYASAGGSGTTLNCSATMVHSVSPTTGFNNTAYGLQAYSTQASFDTTTASTKAGLSFNGGTGSTITIQKVETVTQNL